MKPENNRAIAWLEKNSPDTWMDISEYFNLDSPHSTAALHWIVLQPQCDKATAQCIFFSNNAGWSVEDSLCYNEHNGPEPGIYGTIAKRWNDGSFFDSDIASYEHLEKAVSLYERTDKSSIECWPVDNSITKRLRGTRIVNVKTMLTPDLRYLIYTMGTLIKCKPEDKAALIKWLRDEGLHEEIPAVERLM